MVFESVVTDILNRVLGDYVENLDSKQLKIGIWGGDVVLNNLILKPSALDDLDLPVQTVYGQLDKLVLKIPWKNLYGAAVEANIEGLYILVVPNRQTKYNAEKEALKEEDLKQKEILKFEDAKKKEAEKGKPKPDDSFVEKLTTQIIKNVQLKVSNIHIRYEDKVTHPAHPFSVGITLGNLSLETTDENWKPTIVEEMVTKIYKVVSLEGLAAYWNCNSTMYANLPVVDLVNRFKTEIATRDQQPQTYNYLLGPINSSARLRLNPKPECDTPTFTIPKVHLNLEMEKLSIAITKSQYQDVIALTESMDRMLKGLPYRQFRPELQSYKNHYKEWWHFAYNSVLYDIKRRRRNWDWNHILEHRNMIRSYSTLFKAKMSVKKPSSHVLKEIDQLEKKLDVFNIIIIRQKVEMEIAHLGKTQAQVEKKSWLSSWWGGSNNDDKELSETTDILKKFETAMTPEEKSRLYQAIDYQENSAPLIYPEAYVDQTCTFILRTLEIQVLDDTCSTPLVIDSKLNGVKCRLDTRPAASAIKVAVNIDEFAVYGLQQDDLIPQVVTSKTNEDALLDVLFETNPLDKTCSQRLHVEAKPLKIMYDAVTINKVVDVFRIPQSSTLDQITAAAGERLSDIKEMSATGLQYAIESHAVLDLKIDLHAPYIVVPYGGKYTGVENVLVLNLGRVQISSVPRTETEKISKMHAEGTAGNQILQKMILQSYDVFTLEFTDLQVILSQGGEDWERFINESEVTSSHLLNPMSLNLTFYKCLISDDPRLPLTKIRAQLPSISVNITDVRLLLLVALATSIPFPQEVPPESGPLLKSSRSRGSSLSTLKYLEVPDKQKHKLLNTSTENRDSGRDFIQFTTLDAQFVMKEFSMMVCHQEMSSSPSIELLQFKVTFLECAVVQQTYNTDITVRLGEIGCKQNRNDALINIIDTPLKAKDEDYLFVVKFSQVDKKSPEFHSKYKSCETQLSLQFASLNVVLHQEGLQELLKFGTDLQQQVNEILNTTSEIRENLISNTERIRRMSSITESVSATLKNMKDKSKKTTRVVIETIQFKLVANMQELTVIFASDLHRISSCAVKGLAADVIIKKSYTQVLVNLLDVAIIDLNPKSIYSKILSVQGDEAVKAQVVLYSEEHKSNDPNSVDMSVEVTMGCLRIVFLNWFVTNMLNFLNHFQEAEEKIIEASQAAAESAKQNMQNAYQNAIRISLKISLKAPDIIVPSNSRSQSALLLDLGNLTILNRFLTLEVVNEMQQHAVLDEISLKLTDFSLARVKMCEGDKMVNICTMLQPVTFTLTIKRNLSSMWYRSVPDIDLFGKFDVILLHLSQVDYEIVMSILSGNLVEGQKPSSAPSKSAIQTIENPTLSKEAIVTVSESSTTYTVIKFNFTMERFVITLFTTKSKEQSTKSLQPVDSNALARFSLEVLSVKGSVMSNNTIATSVVLVNCLMDDMRQTDQSKLSRLMERKIDSDATSSNSETSSMKSMIDVVFKATANDTFVDVRVSSFIITLSMEFLMKLSEFFTVDSTNTKPQHVPVTGKSSVTAKSSAKSLKTSAEVEPTMTINLRIEQPDIILVENMNDINTNAIILNTEVLLKLRMAGLHQVISGSINDTQFYTCTYNPEKRMETKSPILHPVSISIAGSTPEGEGLHIEVFITDVRLSISPTTIELLNGVYLTLVDSNASKSDEIVELKDSSHLWDYKPFKENDFWFLEAEAAEDAVTLQSLIQVEQKKKLTELCIVSLPSLIITIEAGVGKKTLPMLLLESSFRGSINDWSSQMTVDASLTLQLGYYNSRLAVWEPLIEPTEVDTTKSTYVPWELKLEVSCNEPDDDLIPSSPTSETEEPVQIQQAAITIDVSSKANLELTVTKTSLEVLNNLSRAFSTAISSKPIGSTVSLSPYTVKNYSGFRVTLSLGPSSFQVYGQNTSADIVLESDAEVPLQLKPSCESNAKLNLKEEMSPTSLQDAGRNLYIQIKDTLKCSLKLPVVRADTRYFNLNYRGDNNDNWGLVSAISVEDGVSTITLRSILQVHNHFNIPVEVYYMTFRDNELECISTIKPGGTLNIPIKAVYTPTSELFFSIAGYSVTSTPFVWKDLQLNLSVTKQMQCMPKKSPGSADEPFIIKAVGETEQVYFENTIRHTMASTCYSIHLHPAVTLKNFLPVDIICCVQNVPTETLVKPGESLQVPNVNPGVSTIVIRLPNYLEKEWSCQHEVLSNFPDFAVWQFDSHDGAVKVSLDLGMHTLTRGGSMIMSLYCPFWMLNKTGLLISYRNSEDNLNVIHHPPTFKGPVLFSFNAKNFFGKKKAAIRIEQGEWSDKFSIDVAGSSGFVICKHNNIDHQIGVHNQLTYNGLTKQVTFTPYYVVINNAPFTIECQESDRPADKWLQVEKDSCSALWPLSEAEDKLLKLKVMDTEEISTPFFYTETHTTLLKLPNKFGGINVDIQITEGAVYINLFAYDDGMAPALVINHTDDTLLLWEKETVQIRKLKPNHNFLYTWENPSGPRVLLWDIGHKKEIEDDLRKDGIGEFSPKDDYHVYWVSFLDGMQRILLFTLDKSIADNVQSAKQFEAIQQEINISIHGVGLSLVNNIQRQDIMYVGIASSGIIWETCKLQSKRYRQLNPTESTAMENAYQIYLNKQYVDHVDFGRMIIDHKTEVDFQTGFLLRPNKRKLRRTFQTGLWLQMKTSPSQLQLHAKINRLQIDNQMLDSVFPVVLAPVPPPKSVAFDSVQKPFAELSIVQRIIKYSQISQYKYFKLLIQEFHVKVDLGFVNAVCDLLENSEYSEQEEKKSFLEDVKLVDQPLLAHVSTQSLQEQKNFYDLLHFSPLKVHISFSMASGSLQGTDTPNFLNVLLQGLGVTLTDMQDVVFRLAYFQREYCFLTKRQLISEATSHYVGQSIKQLYVLVLGLDVLGNPYGLVLGITKGVEDLFYEPFQGAIQGPGEFAEGLVLGVRSLFGHTVGGAAGAVSRITGAMGKGIAVLTFDKDYQRKRRDQINKKPASVQEGLARGSKGLVMGVVDGVTGVFTKPISGAKEQGVEGFFKGLGKGAVGLVTRPTAGVIDFASGSFDAVKRATELGEEANRLRPPRFLQADGFVKPYNFKECEGHKILMEVEKGRYANTDTYSSHFVIIQKKEILMLTDKRLAYITHNDIFGGWQIDWSYTWQEIPAPPKVVPKGVAIAVADAKKKILGFFGSNDSGKIILVGDPILKNRICRHIEDLLKNV